MKNMVIECTLYINGTPHIVAMEIPVDDKSVFIEEAYKKKFAFMAFRLQKTLEVKGFHFDTTSESMKNHPYMPS